MTTLGAISSDETIKAVLASGSDEVTSVTTTSATLEDITGLTFDLTVPTGRTGTIIAWMSIQASTDTSADVAGYAINISTVDKQEMQELFRHASSQRGVSCQGIATGLTAGAHTVKGRHRRASGTGTITTGVAQLCAILLLE